jgi:hypothetical protein
MFNRAGRRFTLLSFAVALLTPASASPQTSGTFKVAFFNIQSGKGEPGLPGRVSTFSDTVNCTDVTHPLNAWGHGIIQRELRSRIASDPAMIALGLGEAWTCASPARVAAALGWTHVAGERNGVGLVTRFGFAGPEEWQQLDTSLNDNPKDTMWVMRVPVCLDQACSASALIAVAHWFAPDIPEGPTTFDRQAEGTVNFLKQAAGEPHVLLGDLNVWESPLPKVCGKIPVGAGLNRLRQAGYTDAWPYLHGNAEGLTGMTNRVGCGVPEGYAWKRIDYAWSSPGYIPVSMTRFGVVPAGEEAPSDHYGIIVEYRRGELQPPETPPETPSEPPSQPPSDGRLGPGDALIYAGQAARITGDWRRASDTTAASGVAMQNPDRASAKLLTASAAPADFFEATFTAERGRPYRLWMRGKAALNAWSNDSVFVQFDASVTAAGAPIWRIGSTSATVVSIEECSGCGLAGWGWADNGYGIAGPLVYFAETGTQIIRVPRREDGITIDQILLSPERYLSAAPGLPKNDTVILAEFSSALEIVRYAAEAPVVVGDWVRVTDATAAGGTALGNPERAVAKIPAPLPSPSNYIELTFAAEAKRPYRLWLRGRAEANAWSNDSVWVQFSGSVTETGLPAWRIGTTSGTWVGIEDCSGCGLSGWGWQDNGYGLGVLGPAVYFATTGPQTIRIQQREDGVVLDQIVISGNRYLAASPGRTKNDTTILPR